MGEKCAWRQALSLKKISILVEGPTEYQFVKIVLHPYFEKLNIFLYPIIIKTKRPLTGPTFKGGLNSYNQVRRDLKPILADTSAHAVTTMLDYYSLPGDFPGFSSIPGTNCYKNVEHLECEFGKDVADRRFIPYLQLHEYETLLFSSPEMIAGTIGVNGHIKTELIRIKNSFHDPELINNDPLTCPHKRIENLIPTYEKPLYGAIIADEIGLVKIRDECHHFNSWIEKLESFA